MGASINPVMQRVKDTVLSIVGVQEELEERQQELQPGEMPDDGTKSALLMLATTVSEIQAFLLNVRSSDTKYVGGAGAKKMGAFRKKLDKARARFIDARIVHLTRQDGASYAMHLEIPPPPAHFYGRNELVDSIVQLLLADATHRIPLLGAGGIGKTSIASAVINSVKVVDTYRHNIVFLGCEGITSIEGIIKTLAAHFKSPSDSRTLSTILAHLGSMQCFLLVLDNFETVVEAADSVEVERYLGKLAELSNLSIMLAMRGNQPPEGVAWETRYHQPLERLNLEASRRIWVAMGAKEDAKLNELLEKLDGLPLAIRIMASQAQLNEESPTQLLDAYAIETTKLLKTRGVRTLKSLEVSIRLSLECPTMTQAPDAL
ncbi:hypothetical protein CALCODRAFT_329727 [Calocera cornea HHB12733]|uniref:Novel STAND NTPase 1 domain-containing protein n=1 Tax=Calocera cornea HHB12733 TaxID=1353952 RepID=A0A165F319_9BASI|nr:hypothetical protein CALCODRAFT_329727 [Calocera cornea HHB12733]